jgi:hypothetical protein
LAICDHWNPLEYTPSSEGGQWRMLWLHRTVWVGRLAWAMFTSWAEA